MRTVPISEKILLKLIMCLFERMHLARKNGDWDVYIEALNSSSSRSARIDSPSSPPIEETSVRLSIASKEALNLTDKFKSRAAVAVLHYNFGEFII